MRRSLRPWRFLFEMGGRFLVPHSLRSREPVCQTPPFFIVSNGRSGTTLLRAMLIQSPAVHIPPEFKLIRPLFNQYQGLLRRLPWEYAVRQFGAVVAGSPTLAQWEMSLDNFYNEAKALPPAQRSLANLIHLFYLCHARKVKPEAIRWGDKTPINILNLDKIDRLFPDAKIVHLLRDGRDVVASIHGLGWHSSLEETCDAWLQNIERVSEYSQRNNGQKYLEVRYESLVSDPEVVLRKLCNFLGISYGPEMLKFFEHRESLGFEATQRHHSGLARPLNPASVGSWRSRLDAVEQQYVMERVGPTVARLGYSL